jgi:tetratricopeptide (TPR) repeat protein
MMDAQLSQLSRVSGEASWTGRLGAWLFVVAVTGAALAAGTVHTVVLCAVTAMLAAAAVLVGWDAETTELRRPAIVLLLTGCVLTAYTAAQCIPLPIDWLAKIAPHNAEIWSRALSPLDEPGPRWAPISLDPTATRIEVLKGVAYLLAFATALRIARHRRGAQFLSEAIIATGLLLAILALLHPAFGAHKLYGVWEPDSYGGRWKHLAPLLNPNNLAGYINVALCLALASSLSTRPRVPRPILIAVAIVLMATQVWVASRGGVLAMILGGGIVVVILRAGRMRGLRKEAVLSVLPVLGGLVVAAAIFMLVLAHSDQAAQELWEKDLSKIELFREALKMVPAYPIWGIGRGAFESAFPAFRETGGYWTATHPENVVLQWVTEWGVPMGAGGLLAIAVALRPTAVIFRSSTTAGAWAAIVAVAAQNLVDLGSEVPGLVLAPVVCAAIFAGGSPGPEPRVRAERWKPAPRTMALAAAVLTGCALVAAAAGMRHELSADQQRLHTVAIEQHAGLDDVEAAARAAMLRHPAEPYFPFIAALRLTLDRSRSPLPWINATLQRSRIHGPAHLALARWLAPRSPSQGRLEYRLAMDQAPELAEQVMAQAPRLVGGTYDAIELTPSGALGPQVLRILVNVLAGRLPATSVRLDEELAKREPADPRPANDEARAAVEDVESPDAAPWCSGTARDACLREAIVRTERAEAIDPRECEPHELHARARTAAGDVTRGLDELSAAADTVDDRVPCLQAVVDFASRAGDSKRAEEAIRKVASAPCLTDAECARNLSWAAAAEERRGNAVRALALYKQAWEHEPDSSPVLTSMAILAAHAGLHAEAAGYYQQLAEQNPADPAWAKAANEQRVAALSAAAAAPL